MSPIIFTAISSRCHFQFEFAKFRPALISRVLDANFGPNRAQQNWAESWRMFMSGSCRRSSTLRSERACRAYLITTRRKVSRIVFKKSNGRGFCHPNCWLTASAFSSRFHLTIPFLAAMVIGSSVTIDLLASTVHSHHRLASFPVDMLALAQGAILSAARLAI